jgi:2-amino-4-hydroxy-6-hydroxymethyldihydropteridine diphosphokinase
LIAQPTRAYIGLGSNLLDPLGQVTDALDDIANLDDTELLRVSSWYRSTALGPGPQPDYINGVALVTTAQSPLQLLHSLQAIENRHGRERTVRWGARTLDLDILLYGNLQLNSTELTIPHPQMTLRNFVLLPLAEIAPALALPNGQLLTDLLANLSAEGIVRVAEA